MSGEFLVLNRVKQQAAIIDAVNKFTPGVKSLAGLSRSAIYDWGKRNVGLELSDVQLILEEVSAQIGSLYDKSNPPKEEFPELEVSQYIGRLENMMTIAMSR